MLGGLNHFFLCYLLVFLKEVLFLICHCSVFQIYCEMVKWLTSENNLMLVRQVSELHFRVLHHKHTCKFHSKLSMYVV